MTSLPSSSQVLTTLLLIILDIFIIAPEKNKKTNFVKEIYAFYADIIQFP
jgi:hypothetical protein